MNEEHMKICSSPEWAEYVENELLPWALGKQDLGDDVLEIGPGPGLTTDVLRRRVAHLTAVEIDPQLAASLATRLEGTNVEVVCADATSLPFEESRFSSVVMFTMLHHVPSPELQNQVFAQARRVLRPGGLFAGTDSVETTARWMLHEGDTYVPVDPSALAPRLDSAGFMEIVVEEVADRFRFLARRAPTR
ncbi:MAG TPA: class I SAM-dependent methyltransferase [Acidimicrobiales bacterium]|nr:class I SAM-dependent methyltransferase [Acidimicrobiales bacterium]